MSISSTRKVSSSTSAPSKSEYAYNRGGQGEHFVEVIDTANSISVNNKPFDEQQSKQRQSKPDDTPKQNDQLSGKRTYIPNALEALAASGVYDDAAESRIGQNLGVYNSNQSIIHNQEEDKLHHGYLKHFYERNEIIEEVDELV